MFDKDFVFELDSCKCCYSCIVQHGDGGCQECLLLLQKFFPPTSITKFTKSVKSELKAALGELFEAMGISKIKVESELEVDYLSLVNDLVKVIDELKSPEDICRFWHINQELSFKMFSVIQDVIFGNKDDLSSSDNDSDESDEKEDVSNTEYLASSEEEEV